MSIQAVAWALEQDLPARPKLVLVAIANHASHTDGYCWLRAETIAKEGACTPRAVFNFVGDLIRNGYLRKELRRGDDGKQRASDYWILFRREPAPWVSRGESDSDEPPQDVDEPHAPGACGEDVDNETGPPVEKHAGSSGPHASTFRRYKAEPSKIKPNENPTDSSRMVRAEGLPDYVPRGYRPPPPQPIADVTQGNPPDPMKFFVIEGTPAFAAWAAVKARENGLRRWHRTTNKIIDGKARSGWYFPSLFPPTGPPESLSDDDLAELAKTG